MHPDGCFRRDARQSQGPAVPDLPSVVTARIRRESSAFYMLGCFLSFFFSLLAAFFSFIDFAGSFFEDFFAFWPLLMVGTPVLRDVRGMRAL